MAGGGVVPAEHQDAPDAPSLDADFGDQWRMAIRALVAMALGLFLGAFALDSVPATAASDVSLAGREPLHDASPDTSS